MTPTYNKSLQLTPRRSLSTELSIFTPFINDPHIFILASITGQWQDQLASIQERLIGLDPMVEKSFYDDRASPIEKKGIFNLLSNALAKEEKLILTIEVVNNSIVFTNNSNPYNTVTNKPNASKPNSIITPFRPNINSLTKIDPNINNLNKGYSYETFNNKTTNYDNTNNLIIDGRNNKTPLLYDYYSMVYLYIFYANITLKLANKPLILMNEMRSQNQGVARDLIEDDVRNALSMLKQPNGFMVLDGKDKITTPDINTTTYEDYIEKAYKGIASVFKLPLSFVTGQWTAGLGSDDAQAQQVEDVLARCYKIHYEPILRRIYEILGLDFSKVIYPEFKVVKLKAISPILQAINQLSYVDDDVKIQLTKELVGIDLPNNKNVDTITNNTTVGLNNKNTKNIQNSKNNKTKG